MWSLRSQFFPQFDLKLQRTLSKSTEIFSRYWQVNYKIHMEIRRTYTSSNNFYRENNAGGFIPLDVITPEKSGQCSTRTEWKRDSRKKSKFKWSTDFWKALQQFYRKGKSLQQITMWQLDKHTEKSESHNTHTYLLAERDLN